MMNSATIRRTKNNIEGLRRVHSGSRAPKSVRIVSEKMSDHEFYTNCRAKLEGYRVIGAKYVLLAVPKIRLYAGHEGATVVDSAETIEEARRKALRGTSHPGYFIEILYLDK